MYQKCSVAAGLTMCLRARVFVQCDDGLSEVLGGGGANTGHVSSFRVLLTAHRYATLLDTFVDHLGLAATFGRPIT